MRALSTFTLTAALCLLLPTLHATEKKKSTVRVNKSQRLAPNAVAEYCAELSGGQVVRYRFEADAPLDFKLHAQGAQAQVVQQATLQSLEYVDFKPPQAAQWCWTWSNSSAAPVQLSYMMFVAPARRVQRK